MVSKKIAVLMVVYDFHQAGTQRFTYEIDSVIDRSRFDVSFLCIRSLGSYAGWDDHYYQKHLALGSKIHFLADFFPATYPISQRVLRKVLPSLKQKETADFHRFINRFDVISFMGEYSFPPLKKRLPARVLEKSLIHIMNARFQRPDLYGGFTKSEKYHFVSGFDEEELRYELAEFSDFGHSFLPLSVVFEHADVRWRFSDREKKKIGIFTRLSPHKPLDPFFSAFHLLLEEFPETELHIFGTGDPIELGFARMAESLYISKNVFFRGHQTDLVKTAMAENLDLVWYQGYNNKPGGFAGYDIASVGIPQLFWDFSALDGFYHNDVYPQFRSLSAFHRQSREVLTNRGYAERLSQTQQEDVLAHRDIRKHIALLEKLYTEKSNRP